jgi:predicted DNA-binding transcriptional regulator AlpA
MPRTPDDQLNKYTRILAGKQNSPPDPRRQGHPEFDHARPPSTGPPDALDAHRCISEPAAADLLGISIDTLRRLVARGEGPARLKISARRVVYRLRDVLAYVKAREAAAS